MGAHIYGKLMMIQQELKAPKGQYNSFAKYNYRSCEDILEAVKPLCIKNNATLLLNDAVQEVSGRFYVVATATLVDTESGDSASVTAYAREPQDKKGMDDSQITGMASSYARKYALNGLFCIDDTKDADTDEAKRQEDAPKKREKKPENKQEASVLCECCGLPIKAVKCGDRVYPTNEIVENAVKKYGKRLCWGCMRAENNLAAGNG
ncbi:MAG: ERF family protein [Oscillospiraceae bacterium]|nr:ERF family protein [Oscillospiraceae bacterium]